MLFFLVASIGNIDRPLVINAIWLMAGIFNSMLFFGEFRFKWSCSGLELLFPLRASQSFHVCILKICTNVCCYRIIGTFLTKQQEKNTPKNTFPSGIVNIFSPLLKLQTIRDWVCSYVCAGAPVGIYYSQTNQSVRQELAYFVHINVSVGSF